ncbi:MAG: manganese transporter permease [Bdellovibrionota bacterium]
MSIADYQDISYCGRWWQFILERFEPVSHLLMISLYFLAHLAVYHSVTENVPALTVCMLLFLSNLAFFFKLRLYDEIKDYETDLKLNPSRPLARGLLNHRDLHIGIWLCITAELLCFGFINVAGFFSAVAAIGYSLLMYREFFIKEYIRPLLTTYAVTHTVVCSMLSVAVLSSLSGEYPWLMKKEFLFFALNSWFLFNIFEFGRKTFTSSEERNGVASYSNIFGRSGAVILVILMAFFSIFCLSQLSPGHKPVLLNSNITLAAMLALTGFIYAIWNKGNIGKIYRMFSSVYIIMSYIIFIWAAVL